MKRFEYHVGTVDSTELSEHLKRMSGRGWRLVNTHYIPYKSGGYDGVDYVLFWERPVKTANNITIHKMSKVIGASATFPKENQE